MRPAATSGSPASPASPGSAPGASADTRSPKAGHSPDTASPIDPLLLRRSHGAVGGMLDRYRRRRRTIERLQADLADMQATIDSLEKQERDELEAARADLLAIASVEGPTLKFVRPGGARFVVRVRKKPAVLMVKDEAKALRLGIASGWRFVRTIPEQKELDRKQLKLFVEEMGDTLEDAVELVTPTDKGITVTEVGPRLIMGAAEAFDGADDGEEETAA